MNFVRQLLEPIFQQCQEQCSLFVVDRQRFHLIFPFNKARHEQFIASILRARELGIGAHDRLRVVEPETLRRQYLPHGLHAQIPSTPSNATAHSRHRH